MADNDFYFTIAKPAVAEFKERGSRFLAFAYPIDTTIDFKKWLQISKKEHPKAAHHCFAYRIGLTGDNFRVNDDGEPAGTAGRPILGQIDSKSITNASIIVVRYFGGTLLGVPGLINAYKTAASLVLQMVPVLQKQTEILYHLQFDYTRLNDVMLLLKQFKCSVLSHEMQLFYHISAGIPSGRLDEVLYRLGELPHVEVKKIV